MKFILGAIVWIFILALAIIPLGILVIAKLIVTVIYRKNNAEPRIVPLLKEDVVMCTHNSWTNPTLQLGFVLEVSGNIEINQFRKHFAECFKIDSSEPYEKFYSYLVTRAGYVFRAISPTLNIDEHILERKLETVENSDKLESLETNLSRWILEKYAENKPSWEIALIPISTGTAVAFKIHHGLCDGYSILHIIDTLTGTKSPYLVKPFTDGLWVQVRQLLETPLNLGKISGGFSGTSPLKVAPSELVDPKYGWLFGFTEFPLESLKILRRKNGDVHMISVICTIISGALRRFLVEEQGKTLESIPEFMMIGNTLPWPEHPAMIEGTLNKDRICNHWSSGGLKVLLRESNPIKRIQHVEAEYTSFLSLGLDKLLKRVMEPVFWTIPTSALNYAASVQDTGLTATLTSLIGGSSYSLLGHAVTRIHPMKAISHDGPFVPFSCFTFSHSGKMELTISVNPGNIVINSQQVLNTFCHKYFQEELRDFLAVTESQET